MVRRHADIGRGFSLWLMPEGPVGERLRDLIGELARSYGTPRFPPHLTLLAGIPGSEVAARADAAELARRLKPLSVRLGEIESSPAFFRCIFARADLTEALRRAEVRARETFSRADSPTFLPHLSLVYGNLSPRNREAVRMGLGRTLKLRFRAPRLHLLLTQGPPETWRPRGVFPLRG